MLGSGHVSISIGCASEVLVAHPTVQVSHLCRRKPLVNLGKTYELISKAAVVTMFIVSHNNGKGNRPAVFFFSK